MPRRLTQDEFIERSKSVHGDRYDYSRVHYVNSSTKVVVGCEKHGWFETRPSWHMRGTGCPKCGVDRVVAIHRDSRNDFVRKAHGVHGNKYDYSKVEYANSYTKVEIVCPVHGSFFQVPARHLSGSGCPECALAVMGASHVYGFDVFYTKAREVHGDKYEYVRSSYIDMSTKTEIICPVHGSFWQKPSNHLQGRGCAACREDARYDDTESFIKKAIAVHGTEYDYSRVDYVDSRTAVVIICPEHGEFNQKPNVHLSGHGCPMCAVKKAQLLRAQNGIGSKAEDAMYSRLCALFGKSSVERQYYDGSRYPFHCDFYVKSRDMFVELNAFFTHGDHWFDINDCLDVAVAENFFDKLDMSSMYYSCLYTWMYSDVEKRETARKNNLNYVVFWDTNLKDFEEWIDAGCPDSHDWEREYAWRFGPEARKADTEGEGVARPERVQPAPDVA